MTIVAVGLTIRILFVLSQTVLSIQNNRREKIKEYKAITQNFILPYLNEVWLFIDLKTDVRKETSLPFIEIQSEELITKMQNQVRYGNAGLVKALYRYFNAAAFYDGRGEAKNLATYDVFYHF